MGSRVEVDSSGSSRSVRPSSSSRARFPGIPKMCSCGDRVVRLLSKSDNNPCRLYYRCRYAAERKLLNDSHVFKWVDEAFVDEIEQLDYQLGVLEEEVMVLKMELRRFRVVFSKWMTYVSFGCFIMVVISKFLF